MSKGQKVRGKQRVCGRFTKEVRDALRRGGIGVLLTDTIYGIVGSALNRKTVERIYRVKGRNFRKPFIVLIAGYGDLRKFGARPTKEQKAFLREMWGSRAARPTSVILPVPSNKFVYLHRGTGAIAFRIPGVPTFQRLLRSSGPLVAPSANPEGQSSAATIEEAIRYFGREIDFYVDGGRREGKPSRLVSLEHGQVRALR